MSFETLRLACLYCDREDFDGTRLTPLELTALGWKEIDHSQPSAGMDYDWFNHIGVCPECAIEHV